MGLETPLKAPLATAHPSYPFSTKLFFFFRICSIVLLCFISWRAAALRSVSPSFKLRHHSWLLLGAFHICTPNTDNTKQQYCTLIEQCTVCFAHRRSQMLLNIANAQCTQIEHCTHDIEHCAGFCWKAAQWAVLTAAHSKIPRPCFFSFKFGTYGHQSTYFRACQSLLVHLGFLFRKLLHISFQVPTAGQSRWAGSGLNRKGADSFPWKLSLKLKTFWINNV